MPNPVQLFQRVGRPSLCPPATNIRASASCPTVTPLHLISKASTPWCVSSFSPSPLYRLRPHAEKTPSSSPTWFRQAACIFIELGRLGYRPPYWDETVELFSSEKKEDRVLREAREKKLAQKQQRQKERARMERSRSTADAS